MKESSELIKKRDVAPDGGAPLERPAPYYPSSRYDSHPEEPGSGYNRLHDYWRSIRKHIWLVIMILVLVTSLTAIYLNTPLHDPTYFNTQITILTSAGLLGRVAKTLDLEHNESFLHPQAARSRSLWESLKGVVG